jgi:hypothetical protein
LEAECLHERQGGKQWPELLPIPSRHAACRALTGRSVITWVFGSSEDSPPPLSAEQAVREVHAAIQRELLSWLCGTWEPVKEPLETARTRGHYP